MTRVVRNQDPTVTTTAVRSMPDSYARPFYHNNTRLQSLSGALERFLPAYVAFDRKKKDEQYRKEVAEGYALAAKYAGQDYSVDAFREMVAKGQSEKMRRLTKAHEHGINQFQMAQGMNRLGTEMQEWYDNATFTDEEGKSRRIAEIEDPVVFDRAFNRALSEKWEQMTGGKYDAQLFKEHFSETARAVHNVINAKFLAARAQAKLDETNKSASSYMDSVFTHLLTESRDFYINPNKAISEAIYNFNKALDVHASTSSTVEAAQWAARYINAQFHDKNPTEINRLLKMAGKIDRVWKNPQYRDQIETAAQQARYQWDNKQRDLYYQGERYRTEQTRQLVKSIIKQHGYVNLTADKFNTDPRVIDNPDAYTMLMGFVRRGGNTTSPEGESTIKACLLGELSEKDLQDKLRSGTITPEEYERGLKAMTVGKNAPTVSREIETLLIPFFQDATAQGVENRFTVALAKDFYLNAATKEFFKIMNIDPTDEDAVAAIDIDSPTIKDALRMATKQTTKTYWNIDNVVRANAGAQRGLVADDPDEAGSVIRYCLDHGSPEMKALFNQWDTFFKSDPGAATVALMGNVSIYSPMTDRLTRELSGLHLNYKGHPIKTLPQLYALVESVFTASRKEPNTTHNADNTASTDTALHSGS